MNTDHLIRVSCPSCGPVDVPPAAITLRHCADDESWGYWFECPSCRWRAAGSSTWWLAMEAFAVGSALEMWRWPDELRESHRGPPLGLVDLLAMRIALAEPDWIDELAGTPDS